MTEVHSAARRKQEEEFESQQHAIAKLERQIAACDSQIEMLQGQGHEQDELVASRIRDLDMNPRDIAPEDALDTIVRLENRLKLEKRKNDMHTKENKTAKLYLKERRKELNDREQQHSHMMAVTGWDGKERSEDEQEEMQQRIMEMTALAAKLRNEHRNAQVIIAKKETLVQFLCEEVEKLTELRERLDMKYNEVRVADRDRQETELALVRLQEYDQNTTLAIDEARAMQDTVAVQCLQEDNAFLKQEVRAKKDKRLEQEMVIKAQVERQRQLQSRIEVIGAAVRDLGYDRQLNASMAAALQTAEEPAPAGEPDDLDRINPPNEVVPVAVYELLHRDMEVIRGAVSRKDVMVVEKKSVVAALQQKYERYQSDLELARVQKEQTRVDKVLEMQHLHQTLADKHTDFRKAIDDMLHRNLKIKNEVIKRARPKSAPAAA